MKHNTGARPCNKGRAGAPMMPDLFRYSKRLQHALLVRGIPHWTRMAACADVWTDSWPAASKRHAVFVRVLEPREVRCAFRQRVDGLACHTSDTLCSAVCCAVLCVDVSSAPL